MRKQLQALRSAMAEHKLDAYLIPTDDFHGSEYVGEYFTCRKYVSGFTGSAGTLLVFPNWAGLWTDGRTAEGLGHSPYENGPARGAHPGGLPPQQPSAGAGAGL